jgi:N-acetylmuramoyl-L-alanine amidase
MTELFRAARFAATCLLAAGLLGTSSAGLAETVPAVAIPTSSVVPQPVPAVATIATLPAPAVGPDATLAAPAAPRFSSLNAAVAAQVQGAALSDDVQCLAGAIFFESKGEPLAGQLAVAEVILNRARSGRFAGDVCGVVTQKGQFSFVRGGRIPAVDQGLAAWRTAVAVAKVAVADHWDSPASDALYFNGRGTGFGRNLTRVAAIGNHVFYR